MPQKVIKFGGINRRVNEFDGVGSCEELINLRPGVGGGLSVVKLKNTISKYGVPYKYFYEHSFGNVTNFIVITNDGDVNV